MSLRFLAAVQGGGFVDEIAHYTMPSLMKRRADLELFAQLGLAIDVLLAVPVAG